MSGVPDNPFSQAPNNPLFDNPLYTNAPKSPEQPKPPVGKPGAGDIRGMGPTNEQVQGETKVARAQQPLATPLPRDPLCKAPLKAVAENSKAREALYHEIKNMEFGAGNVVRGKALVNLAKAKQGATGSEGGKFVGSVLAGAGASVSGVIIAVTFSPLLAIGGLFVFVGMALGAAFKAVGPWVAGTAGVVGVIVALATLASGSMLASVKFLVATVFVPVLVGSPVGWICLGLVGLGALVYLLSSIPTKSRVGNEEQLAKTASVGEQGIRDKIKQYVDTYGWDQQITTEYSKLSSDQLDLMAEEAATKAKVLMERLKPRHEEIEKKRLSKGGITNLTPADRAFKTFYDTLAKQTSRHEQLTTGASGEKLQAMRSPSILETQRAKLNHREEFNKQFSDIITELEGLTQQASKMGL